MAKLTTTDGVTGAVKDTVKDTVGGLGEYLREQRRQAQLSLRQLAEESDVSNPYLSQIERGLRRPSAEVLQQIAKALRISAESLYVRAGILDADRSGARMVEDAIGLDPRLTERQKSTLLDIYRSFVGSDVSVGDELALGLSEQTENTNVQEDTP
ncbi:MAG: helix-turn-helix domain-containing protein [Aeromicrobium sp.]|uniref:helix-turn-helix domain-containing protein n=1 Tax=Aeromicrobium sp. TaxID=1871063 RepID=UPI0025BA5DD2|nr:helix-turn-helix domain-containing protein [Aeromicrobium sp.]MCK5891399.1 helix-turn-helix domain-containing protein [Aeromicrobium sp.]MDF1704455.1 helix-turn-helix domain-containing protein [Aeromicrobium sp.]